MTLQPVLIPVDDSMMRSSFCFIPEKKRFERAIASGELSKMIERWDPWWLRPSARTIYLGREGTQLVQPITKEEEKAASLYSEGNQASEIPPGPETPLPPLSKLSSKEPSPLLAVHLVDILYSYCFTLRLYNGDWQSDAIGSVSVVLTVSSVLGQGGHLATVSDNFAGRPWSLIMHMLISAL